MGDEEALRRKLRRLLEGGAPDYEEVLELSSRLANLDGDSVRFTADSGIIGRLGRELVARQETAVSELVKNAYDADARRVELIFRRAHKPGGELLVQDDGLGMTRADLVDGFMRLASTKKLHEPISSRYGRQRAGRKGIGRFAVQRLGQKLTLTTQTERGRKALSVTIDWKRYEQERDLGSVSNRIEEIPKERKEGTSLRILRLREAWSDSQIARVYRYVSDLLQPFPLSKRLRTHGGQERDPGFKALLFREVDGKKVEVASEDRMVFDYALAEVEASVGSSGIGHWRVRSAALELNEGGKVLAKGENAKGNRYKHLQKVHLRAYYFIWDSDLIPGQQLSRLRALAAEQGGIRLYRNGFRVLPYGESKNDWLGLDDAYRKRSVLMPIANFNWFGFVQVDDPNGDKFEETSSREGLANNEPYRELVSFVSTALINAATRVASRRERKVSAGQKDFRRQPVRQATQLLADVANNLERAAEELEDSQAGGGSAAVFRGAAQSVREAAAQSEALIQELAMLRVLSSLGLTIGIFTHEVRHQLFNLKNLVRAWLGEHKVDGSASELLPVLEKRLSLLQSYTAYFDAAVSANVRRELEPQNVSAILFEFIDQFRPIVARDGAEFIDGEIEEDLTTRPMHASEWTSILGNLLTNSIKAIKRGPHSGQGRILIGARKKGNMICVDFADNGDGVNPANKDKIFDAFFTTTNSGKDDELTGMGLGLKIVRDIISASGGTIELVKPPAGFATCFHMEVPAAPDK